MTTPFYWVTKDTIDFMSKGYLLPNETVQSRVKDIANTLSKTSGVPLSDKFYKYMSLGYYSLSSPIWANFGRDRGLPISCNGGYVQDSVEGMVDSYAEVATMTKHGAGTSVYLGAVRGKGEPVSAGGQADGVILPGMMLESCIDNISQGNVRRGNIAMTYPIDGPDILDFLNFREEGSGIQKSSLGVTVSDKFMQEMIEGDSEKRKVWAKVIRKRFETGYPYIFWSDTVNKSAPQVYKDTGRTIWASNLCQEVCLSSSPDESFVCDLSSMNLLTYDEWKDTDAVEVLVHLLDAVMSEYITKTKNMKYMEKAHKFAVEQRALGIGTLGYHSYLQSKGIPFESEEAREFNREVHKLIQEKSHAESSRMAHTHGEPALLKGYGKRNVTLTAIAPTTSSSFILGQVSPSIEPLASNYFTKDLAKGKFTYKNPYLKDTLIKHDADTKEVWTSILERGGSVQHLGFLSPQEKAVFKTFQEINQYEIIIQAAERQEFIDQSQSLNLMVHPSTPAKEVNQLMISAWKLGVKTLYYQRGTNAAQETAKNLVDCTACSV